jgi:hypothetical protein
MSGHWHLVGLERPKRGATALFAQQGLRAAVRGSGHSPHHEPPPPTVARRPPGGHPNPAAKQHPVAPGGRLEVRPDGGPSCPAGHRLGSLPANRRAAPHPDYSPYPPGPSSPAPPPPPAGEALSGTPYRGAARDHPALRTPDDAGARGDAPRMPGVGTSGTSVPDTSPWRYSSQTRLSSLPIPQLGLPADHSSRVGPRPVALKASSPAPVVPTGSAHHPAIFPPAPRPLGIPKPHPSPPAAPHTSHPTLTVTGAVRAITSSPPASKPAQGYPTAAGSPGAIPATGTANRVTPPCQSSHAATSRPPGDPIPFTPRPLPLTYVSSLSHPRANAVPVGYLHG